MGMGEPKLRNIHCKGCNEVYFGRFSKQAKYCSAACYRKSLRPDRMSGKMHQCEICTKDVYIQRFRINKSGAYFCSVEHQNQWQSRNKDDYVCKICSVRFFKPPSTKFYFHRTYCSMKCRDADPDRKEMLRKLNVSQQENKINNLETLGYLILDNLGFYYEKQKLLFDKFCVDAYLPDYNIVIQFDGDYWHGNSEIFEKLSVRQLKRVQLDKSQDAYLNKCGIKVLRFWESEIKKDNCIIETKVNHAVALTRLSANDAPELHRSYLDDILELLES